MIAFVLVFSLVAVAVLELLSRREDLRRVHTTFSSDMDLVEPGETFTLRFTVCNTGSLPILCMGFTLQLDDALTVREDEEWAERHVTKDLVGTRIDYNFYLLPHRRFSGKVRLSINKRGMFDLGRYYVETGDLMGLSPTLHSDNIGVRVICTSACAPLDEPDTLGGFLGDVSVRRFIHEDPCMLIGYSDYTGREPMKQISWFQTAKAGKLTVRRLDHTVDRNVTLVVNMEAFDRYATERCLEMTRTVCEQLEERNVPYALDSNGDLHHLYEGLGRSHLFLILRRIGLSRLTGYLPFASLVDYCIEHRKGADSYIVVTPVLNAAGERALRRLQAVSDTKICVLVGEEK